MPEFITVKASISSVKIQHFRYAACPLVVNGKPCNVKATSNGDGTWRCKRCGLSFGSCNNGITVKASISSVKTQHLCYAFCPLVVNGKPCNAKATSNGDGTWRCKRCGLSFGSCNNGYSVRIQIQDHTGTAFATAYEEAADEIFGCTAKDLYTMKYKDQDYAQLNDIRHSVACKQYVFQLMKVEANPFSEGWPVECIVLKAEEVDPSAESRRLLGAIDMDLLEGLGPCFELGNSMPTWCSSPSDLKGPSTMQSSNISYAICPARSARERCLPVSSNQMGTPQSLPDPHSQRSVFAGVLITVVRRPALWTLVDTDHPHLQTSPWAVSTMLVAPWVGCMVLCLPRLRLDARRKRGMQTSPHGAEESRGEP
ncbi:hypothetical protein BS78_K240300 [Paspalum vaginatum]|uniref:Replication factor A C-terminal domain-containing protein n=1 Tax=Paspalum vaginatum TaxID=158149 RepID=A0A9W7XAM5_9POAL|nr:hypothetical protein BS78_K240300 [Paspalum vaginatum]